jgi:ribonuclease HI
LEESWFLPLNPGKLSESGEDPKLQAWEIRKNSTEFLIWKKKVGRHLLVFYGASKGNPGKAGGGGLFDPGGNLIWKFSWGLGVETNNVAEALALWQGLSQASHLGITDLTVVGDSRLIIQVVITRNLPPSCHLKQVMKCILALLPKFSDIGFYHVLRAHNGIADQATNEAFSLSKGSLKLNNALSLCLFP